MLRRKVLKQAFMTFDLVAASICFAVAAALIAYPPGSRSLTQFLSIRVTVRNVVLFFVLIISWRLILSAAGLYASYRISSFRREVTRVLIATLLSSLAVWGWASVGAIDVVTPMFVVTFMTLASAVLLASRIGLRYLLKRLRLQGRNLRHLVIVGTNPRAMELARTIQARPELGYRLAGFADDSGEGAHRLRESDFRLVTTLEDFEDFLRENVIDEVMICLPMKSMYPEASCIAIMCEKIGVTIRFHFDLFDIAPRTDAPDPLVTLYSGAVEGWPLVLKRGADVLLAAVFIVAASPLLVVAALLVRLTSPGPVIFVQERVGLNRRRFGMYKFRTMRSDAEEKLAELENLNEVDGPVFKLKNDPRVTGVGRLLRRTSLDELPQLFNVLKGDMSLVGPRPLPVRDYNGFTTDWHRRRFSVRPGLTCLWQIGGRSSVSFDEWMELDMRYVDNWSLWLDVTILVKTIPAVLKGTGAT